MLRTVGGFIFATVFLVSASAFAAPGAALPPPPDSRAFLAQANAWWRDLRSQEAPASGSLAGTTGFLPIAELIRGQDQISVDNILAKFQEHVEAKNASWDPASGRWSLAQDGGRSLVPLNDPIAVIRGPQGYVIIDGHHDLFLSLYLHATTIAVRVAEDLSDLSPREFWDGLRARNLVLLNELNEDTAALAERVPEMTAVTDNPNRYLATLLAAKAKADFKDGTIGIRKTSGSKTPIWIKLNDSVPFIEFTIADVLARAGIRYDPRWGTTIPREVVESARRALLEAQAKGEIAGLSEIPALSAREAAEVVASADGFKSVLETSLRARGFATALCASAFGP